MNSTRALRHLILTFDISLGIQQVPDTSIPILRHIFYVLFNVWFTTWPKGLRGPDFLTPEPEGDFAAEQVLLLTRMKQFVDALEREPERIEVNPSLGAMPLRKWSRAHGVHCDHHLRQFGV